MDKNPKHSLFRSASIVKEYKKRGGKYKKGSDKGMNINKWLKTQNWLSANDYLRGKEVKCGNSNTQKKFNEFPLCRPKAILDKMSKDEIKKLIAEKNKLGSKHLITKKILNTNKYNIKSSKTGAGVYTTNSDDDYSSDDYII